jgi:hypothetical protein
MPCCQRFGNALLDNRAIQSLQHRGWDTRGHLRPWSCVCPDDLRYLHPRLFALQVPTP